jgi:superfamily I DNA/RNA helicase|tara:strand:- start:2248 stop:3924 length:1677 start_codon:yes stop_codon:yes gene_type:complete
MKKIRIAGPPGTGKTTFLVETFYNSIQDYSIADILVISHTRAAANHIRDEILSTKNIESYQKKYKKEIFYKVTAAKSALNENVSTIHKYCKDQLKVSKDNVFEVNDYNNLINSEPLFNKHTKTKTFKHIQALLKQHPFFKFFNFARDTVGKTKEDLISYHRRLTYEERKEFKYTLPELLNLATLYTEYKTDINLHSRVGDVLDFTDMIEYYCERANDPFIKVLIVDEAQDSSVVQRQAEVKMSKNCDFFYKAGDPDQAIFEFSGADPKSFHLEFAKPEVELKEGYRCPRVINEYCKKIIQPIWEKFQYQRVWLPREELDKEGKRNGVVAEGEIYGLNNLKTSPYLKILIQKLKSTKETFIFTHRAGKADNVLEFLKDQGMPMDFLGESYPFKYPKAQIKNHREFSNFVVGEKLTLSSIKKIFKEIDFKYLGFKYSEDNMDLINPGSYTMDYFIKNNYLISDVKKTTNFQEINKPFSFKMQDYIKKIVDNDRDLDGPKIFVANIHKIKGLEYDNVILDQKLTRPEPSFTKIRLKFVACSRAKKSLFLIKSSNNQKGLTL